jgi:hypothetical protein
MSGFVDGGFYWVRLNDEWTVARYDANEDGNPGLEWSVIASDEVFNPEDFDEIAYEIKRWW